MTDGDPCSFKFSMLTNLDFLCRLRDEVSQSQYSVPSLHAARWRLQGVAGGGGLLHDLLDPGGRHLLLRPPPAPDKREVQCRPGGGRPHQLTLHLADIRQRAPGGLTDLEAWPSPRHCPRRHHRHTRAPYCRCLHPPDPRAPRQPREDS